MKALFLIAVVAVIGLAVAFFAMEKPGKSPDGDSASAAKVEAEIAAIKKSQTEFAATLQRIQEKLDRGSDSAARISQSDIDMAVSRALEARETEKALDAAVTGGAGAGKNASSASSKAGAFDVKATFAMLTNPNTSWDESERIWEKARDAGAMDELLEAFEDAAEGEPNNAEVQAQLGAAYIQKLRLLPQGPESGPLAMKADASFDRSLKLDDHNWTARFMKATSLTFWPAAFGKQPEAIKHYEILIEQQEKSKLQPGFAETYVFLGNIYAQQGKMDKAQDIYKKGLALFPSHAELKKKLEMAESK